MNFANPICPAVGPKPAVKYVDALKYQGIRGAVTFFNYYNRVDMNPPTNSYQTP
jgi:hypothetical protein